MSSKLKKIILEEHFSTPEAGKYATKVLSTIDHDFIDYVKPRLADIGAMRIEDMDKNGIDISVISVTTPGVQAEPDTATAVKEAKHLNDLLAEQVRAPSHALCRLWNACLAGPGRSRGRARALRQATRLQGRAAERSQQRNVSRRAAVLSRVGAR